MVAQIKMPALSPTMTEGKLSKWLIQKSSKVVSGDVIAEIETDKATMEIEAVDDGVLYEIFVEEGTDNVAVGSTLALIKEDSDTEDKINSFLEKNNDNNLSENSLKNIAKTHFEKMRKEQSRARSLRNLLVSDCEDEELDRHFDQFAKPEVIELINEIGDIEKPVPLGLALLKKVPAFRKLALRAGVKMIFS